MKKNEHRSVESKKKAINRDTHRERRERGFQSRMIREDFHRGDLTMVSVQI